MTTFTRKSWPILLLLALLPFSADARVVINEVFYNAPNDIDDLEYIELHNSGDQAVDLGGWAFTKGIKFSFAPGTRIDANGFLVLCRKRDRFQEFYDVPVLGVFDQKLSNKSERLELSDTRGRVVDAVKYQDSAAWPKGADGLSGSLERICPEASGQDASNWASSPLSADRLKPAGTPGRANANYSAHLPPVITNVKFTPENPAPDQSISVETDVTDLEGVREVNLLFRLAGPGFEKPESSLPMQKLAESRYGATIPGQAKDQLIRFRIQAFGKTGARRFFPAETEPRPALSSYVHGPIDSATIPFAWIIHTTEEEFKAAQQSATSPGRGGFNPGMFDGGRRGGGPGGPGGFGGRGGDGGPGGRGRGGFGPATMLAPQMLSGGDKNGDQKLTREEFAALADAWFDKLDPEKSGKLSQEQFMEKLGDLLPPPQGFGQGRGGQRGGGQGPGGRGGFGPAMFLGPGLFSAADTNKDASLTRDELKTTFVKWFTDWDSDKSGSLDEGKLSAGLNAAVPPPQFGGPGGFGGGERGPGGPGGFNPGPFGGGRRGGPGGFRGGPAQAGSSRSAFVYFDPETRKLQVFDFVEVNPRKGGHKVHFAKGQLLNQMTAINLIYEFSEKSVLAEALAYEVYRKAGMAAEQSHFVRLSLNGQPVGYDLLVEQPNRAFLRRNKIPDDGNLYKILWYERGVVGQHEKKTNTRDGHEDIVALVDALEKTNGDERWEVIKKNFDVDQVVNYFAVNTVLSHWDGFFNNYFTYHDINGTGKWTMYPWDQDNTWGIIGMMGSSQVFYDMPITFGMEGDQPPGRRDSPGRGRGFGGGFGGGGGGWWRAPGYFSGPLLANPQFRKLFLARTREIVERVYTEDVFIPMIDAMGERLKPEVKLRAELMQNDPERAMQSFEQNLQGFREHLRKRRAFLLDQDEIKNAGK